MRVSPVLFNLRTCRIIWGFGNLDCPFFPLVPGAVSWHFSSWLSSPPPDPGSLAGLPAAFGRMKTYLPE
eukprot:15728033-Heterocapsa_arctica.AAC.1